MKDRDVISECLEEPHLADDTARDQVRYPLPRQVRKLSSDPAYGPGTEPLDGQELLHDVGFLREGSILASEEAPEDEEEDSYWLPPKAAPNRGMREKLALTGYCPAATIAPRS